jgi:O-antigen ligase
MVQMGVRLDNSYTNINSIGMLAAIGILIQFDELLGDKRWSVPVLFCVPSIYMIAATQSRKALVMLVVGVFMILILRNIDNKDALETILRVTAICILFCAAFYVAMMLPVFAGVAQRMKGLIAMVTGKGEMGASASIRKQMVQIGMEQFRKTPLVGIGIGCPHYISAKKLSFDAYLHNNYVELLAAGGVIGFVLYYGIYVYLIGNLWAIKIRKSGDYIIVCTLIIVFLIKDYGMVSMYSKSTYFYFVIFFLAVRKMRKRKNLMNRRRKYIR